MTEPLEPGLGPGPVDRYRMRLERALHRIARTEIDVALRPEDRDTWAARILRSCVEIAREAMPNWRNPS